MTIAGLLWGAIALVLFFYPNIKYLLALTMVGMTLQCVNVVQISGQGIGPQIITSALFVARVILMELPQIRVPVRRNACLHYTAFNNNKYHSSFGNSLSTPF